MQQRENGGLARAGTAHQADFLPGRHIEIETLEHILAARIAETHLFEPDCPAAHGQRPGVRRVQHFMRQSEHLHRFAKLRELLHHIHQCHRKIARGVQDGEAQSGGQNHVAGGNLAPAP